MAVIFEKWPVFLGNCWYFWEIAGISGKLPLFVVNGWYFW